jgi:NAD(P)H-dependent FMN reductase
MEYQHSIGGILENYIVRIYRRVENNPRILVGVVEEVGVEGNKAFTNLEELWKILNSPKAKTRQGKKSNKP